MSRKEKLIQRFKLEPKDFSFEELITLLGYCGYILESSGKTSGSVVTFTKKNCGKIKLHKPHRSKYLLEYQIKAIKNILEKGGLL